MSDGAGDQLFLALRIATLEHWFEHHEPVPFIVDDVLLSFDDDRALAALSALANLSRKTQIVFFTHHDHMLNMAQRALPGVLKEGEYSLCADWAYRVNRSMPGHGGFVVISSVGARPAEPQALGPAW